MKTLESNSTKYGILTAVALVTYFLIMRAFGLAQNYQLRFLNGVIMFSGIYFSIVSYKKNQHHPRFEYLEGLGEGVFTALITAVIFTSFLIIYLLIDQPFMNQISQQQLWGHHVRLMGVAIIIFMEALVSGSLFSFICMQRLKQNILPEVEQKVKEEKKKNTPKEVLQNG